ncbi:MAG: citrate synthase [Candidatus Schekmanbacteria bacterium]|nr:citrate synthase [Candidatus Schekmanbacteria bacterium]
MTAQNSLTITDNRTGRTYEIPIEMGTIDASHLRQIRASDDDFGLMSYDPAFKNTASCRSAITELNGERGILRHRGYAIEALAENCSFLEVAYLVLNGELPTQSELDQWVTDVANHTLIHKNVARHIEGFQHDAHPMGIFVSSVAALSTFYPDAKNVFDAECRKLQILRLIAKTPTIAAFAHRHSQGMTFAYPDNDLAYVGNFLNMMFKMTELKYKPNPVFERALNVLFICHADHEQNCSTTSMRVIASSQADPYCALSGAAAALYGPLHGGANEAVVRMLQEIGTVDNIPSFLASVKRGERRLMGFGHRVYRAYDPRAKIIKRCFDEVFTVTGRSPLLDVAVELERIALQEDYFISRQLYPNVDFYSGLIYKAMNFPMTIFPVLFAIPRTVGWLAHWQELLLDKEQKISRPRQVYVGVGPRPFVPRSERG